MLKRKSKQTESESPRRRKRGRRLRRLLFLGFAGGGAALASSKGLRNKLLDKVFGAEEEFQYSPPAEPAAGNGTAADSD